MSGSFTEGLSALITTGGSLRHVDSQFSGLRANGMLIEVIMTPSNGASWSFDQLKTAYLSASLRQKGADNLQLLDNCRLYDLLALSDFNAGVSMTMDSKKTSTAPVEISGYIDFGFFALGNEESVELLLNADPALNVSMEVVCKWVFFNEKDSRILGYKSSQSTGGEQAERDVHAVYYIGAPLEINATIRDYEGSQSVNLRDAIHLANAIGRFETFTDFGVLYTDPFGVSQDLALRLADGKNLLTQTEFFSKEKAGQRNADSDQRRNSVFQVIYSSKPEKYALLKAYGEVPANFIPR